MSDMHDLEDDEKRSPVRVMDESIHVHLTHWTDSSGSTEEMLFRLEMWPVEQELGQQIMAELAKKAMDMLDAAGVTKGRQEWSQNSEDALGVDLKTKPH